MSRNDRSAQVTPLVGVLSLDATEESLALLEWAEVSRRVAQSAATDRGRRLLLGDNDMLEVPDLREQSERLLALTRDVYYLTYVLARPLSFNGVHDVADDVRLTQKGGVLDGKQLLRVADTMGAARKIRKHIETAAAQSSADDAAEVFGSSSEEGIGTDEEARSVATRLRGLRELVTAFRTWPEVEYEIRGALDDFGFVQDSCDPELAGVRKQIREVTDTIRQRLNNIMSVHADAIQDRVISTRYDRFVISVKTAQKSVIKGVVHDVSATGATAYIEPQAVRALNDKLRELAARERARVMAILRKLSVEVVAPTADDVDHFTSVLATVDAAAARAYASRSLDGVDVVFDDSQPLDIRGVRHPLLSWKAMDAEESAARVERRNSGSVATANREDQASAGGRSKAWKEAVVPADYVLRDGVRCVCVTGPNTGGKTIALKSLGVSILMAKAGLFVSAEAASHTWRGTALREALGDEGRRLAGVSRMRGIASGQSLCVTDAVARMPYFDHVLVDIGDDQSLVQSLSTFSGHIQRIKRILCRTTPRSLVLLDEIGSGTDPAEGAALGMALLKHLAGADGLPRAGLTFATTHHGELKTLKYEGDDDVRRLFENASVEFDDERMAPTFRLLWGIPGRSNALAIARRLGLHSGVVSSAEGMLTGAEADDKRVDVSRMIAELEREKREAESMKLEAQTVLSELESLRSELDAKLKDLKLKEEELRREYKENLENELSAAQKKIGETIREMQRSGSSMRAAGDASVQIDALRAETASSFASAPVGGDIEVAGGKSGKAVGIGMVQPGFRVIVPRLGSGPVEIVDIDEGRNELTVAVGGMRGKIKMREVVSVLKPRRPEAPAGHAPGSALARKQAASRKSGKANAPEKERLSIRTSANTVDVRGERVEEAESNVDLAISRSLGMGTMWIIHGHGTGRLRTGLHSFLSQHSNVER